jgi:hypothetical protein
MSADIVSQTNMHSTEIEDWWIGGPFHSTNPLGCTGVENPYYQLTMRVANHSLDLRKVLTMPGVGRKGVYFIIQLS